MRRWLILGLILLGGLLAMSALAAGQDWPCQAGFCVESARAQGPEYVYAGLADGTVLRSSDDGANWTTVATLAGAVRRLAVLDGKVYAAVGATVQRSADNGANWTTVYTASGTTPAVWKVQALDGALYALAYDTDAGHPYGGYVARSTDGVSWSAVLTPTPGCFLPVGVDDSGAGLYVAFQLCDDAAYPTDMASQVWGSADGTSWSRTGQTGAFNLFSYAYHDGKHWAGRSSNGIYYSADASSWSLVGSSPTSAELWDDGTTMFASAGDLWRSTDDGATWTAEETTGSFLNRAVTKTGSGAFLAAGSTALFRSSDGGDTWTSVHTGDAISVAAGEGAVVTPTPTATFTATPNLTQTAVSATQTAASWTATPTPTRAPITEPRPRDVFPCIDCAAAPWDWNLRSGCGTNDLWAGIAAPVDGFFPGYVVAIEDASGARVCSRTLTGDNRINLYKRIFSDEMVTPGGSGTLPMRCGTWPEVGRVAIYNPEGVLAGALPYDATGQCGAVLDEEGNWATPVPTGGPTVTATATGTLSPTPTRTFTPTPPGWTPVPGAAGLVMVRDFNTTITPQPGQGGSHRDLYWSTVQPDLTAAPSWSAAETRVAQIAGQGMGAWLSLNFYECAWGASPDVPYVPAGVPTVEYTAGACGTERAPKFDDPGFRNPLATAIASFGATFNGNADVDGIAIQAGCSGEATLSYNQTVWATPTPAGSARSFSCSNQTALEATGITCDEYVQFVKDLVDWHRLAFPSKVLTLATGLSACSTMSDWRAIRDLMAYAEARGVLFRYNGLQPDSGNALRPLASTPYPYGRLQYGAHATTGAAFEPGAPFGFPTQVPAAGLAGFANDMALAGLAAGADYLFLQRDWFGQLDAATLAVITATIGTDATDSPMAWLRFRDREFGQQGPSSPNFTYDGWQGPFGHLAGVVGVATPVQYCSPFVRATAQAYGGTPPAPCPQALTSPAAAESRNNLFYAAGAVVGIDVDDGWLYAGPAPGDYDVRLIYLDKGTDALEVAWRTAAGVQRETITKANSNTWQTATVQLDDAVLDGGLTAGADLEIRTATGGEYLHMVTIEGLPGGRGLGIDLSRAEEDAAAAQPLAVAVGLFVVALLVVSLVIYRLRRKS